MVFNFAQWHMDNSFDFQRWSTKLFIIHTWFADYELYTATSAPLGFYLSQIQCQVSAFLSWYTYLCFKQTVVKAETSIWNWGFSAILEYGFMRVWAKIWWSWWVTGYPLDSCGQYMAIFSSVRSSNSHPDLLLTQHPPTFSDHTGPQHWTFTFWATTAI